jgi:hypothetical protein
MLDQQRIISLKWGVIAKIYRDTAEWIGASRHDKANYKGNFDSMKQVFQVALERCKLQSKTLPQYLGVGVGVGSPSPVWTREYSSPS